MQAAISAGANRIGIESIPTPEPGPGDVLVRVEACGICGSDLHLLGLGGLPPGMPPGHEMMGTVAALGEGATGVAVGQRVAIEPFRTCGVCAVCRAGRGNLCREGKLLGIGGPGGLAEWVTAPARRAFAVAEGLAAPVAALAEPLSVALHGLRRVAFEPGQRVLVLGAGSVGLLTVLAARALGAGEVIVTARHPHQAERAEALGADRVLREAQAEPMALAALGAEHEIDVVVETVGGSADTLNAAGAAVRPGGAVSVLGFFTAPVRLQAIPLMMKEVTLGFSYCYEHGDEHADFADALAILDRQRDAAASLVTHELPLAEVEQAYRIAADRRSGAIKVTLRP